MKKMYDTPVENTMTQTGRKSLYPTWPENILKFFPADPNAVLVLSSPGKSGVSVCPTDLYHKQSPTEHMCIRNNKYQLCGLFVIACGNYETLFSFLSI